MEFRFIAPKRPSLEDVLLHEVRARSLPADDLAWFVQAFVDEAKLTSSEENLLLFSSRSRWTAGEDLRELLQHWDRLLAELVQTWEKSHDLADLMLELMSPLWWTESATINVGIARAALAECKRRKLDLTVAASKETNTAEVRRLIALLDNEGLVDADMVVASSIPKLVELAGAKSLSNGNRRLNDHPELKRAAEPALFWLQNDPARFGRAFLPWLDGLEPTDRGRWSCAFCAGYSATSEQIRSPDAWNGDLARGTRSRAGDPSENLDDLREGRGQSLELLRAVFDRLDHWRQSTKTPMTWDEARAWMACYLMRSSRDAPEWFEAMRPQAGAIGLEQLGRMRPIVRERTEGPECCSPQGWSEHLSNCVQTAEEAGLWWEALERLLLLFRELRVPAVLSDLRYWYEHPTAKQGDSSSAPEQPPKYWSLIPRLIARTIHGAASHYDEADRSLTELRTRFAEFCVNRISSRKGSNAPAESDPYWRAAYIGALGELYCNPSGRAHQAIYTMILQRDSEEADVREIAKSVYDDLRHARQLPNQVSARMALFSAFVWLRQAHLITTAHCQPSGDLNVTLVQEVRRTTEPLTPQEVE